jgi:hypothetical protein
MMQIKKQIEIEFDDKRCTDCLFVGYLEIFRCNYDSSILEDGKVDYVLNQLCVSRWPKRCEKCLERWPK